MLSMTGWFLLVRSLEALDVDEAEEEASEAVEAAAELSDGLVLPPCGWPLPPAETIPALPPRSYYFLFEICYRLSQYPR